jgi:DNA repair ATPase RecN
LESAYTVAYNAWQSQEAAYRTAQSAHESAKEAAEYAKGKFDEYTSALSAAEAERDSTIPGLETEKEELVAQQPILEQVKTLVANMASGAEAKSRVQFLKQLPAIAKLADSIVPTENRAIASKVKAMKTQLAETATSSTVTKMLVVIDGIITTMAARIVEIGENIQRISDSVNDSSAKLSEWQTKLVDLSEEKDKAANVENTADLERSQLNGENVVAEEAYNDYHAGFVDEAEKLTKQVAALVTIGGKIDEAISSCSAE